MIIHQFVLHLIMNAHAALYVDVHSQMGWGNILIKHDVGVLLIYGELLILY